MNIYVKRINDFSKMLAESNVLNNNTFLDVENEINRIRGSGDDIIENRLYHTIRDIFGYICSFHQNPSKYKEAAIIKWFSEITKELRERKFLATYEFINWLVNDIKNGSAL